MIVHDANSNSFQLVKTSTAFAAPSSLSFRSNDFLPSSAGHHHNRHGANDSLLTLATQTRNSTSFKCPNCGSFLNTNGFNVNVNGSGNGNFNGNNNSNNNSNNHNSGGSVSNDGQDRDNIHASFARRRSDVFNNRYNRNFKYVNNNYFKLLALSSNFDENQIDSQDMLHGSGGLPALEVGSSSSSSSVSLLTHPRPDPAKILSLENENHTSAAAAAATRTRPALPLLENPSDLASKLYEELPANLFTQEYFAKFFKVDKLLGRGSNAVVYKVEHFINNFSLGYFAVKKIPIGNDTRGLSRILREVELLCLLSTSNKNLVKYNHVWLEISQVSDFGPQVPCAFILTEYCDGGNLEDMVNNLKTPKDDIETRKQKVRELRKRKRQQERDSGAGSGSGSGSAGNGSANINNGEDSNLTNSAIDNNNYGSRLLTIIEILKFFKDIVTGVYELHLNHIIHRDLKPSNCLLSTRYEDPPDDIDPGKVYDEIKYKQYSSLPSILVSDFGESQFEGKTRNSTGATGTLEFVAPELLTPAVATDISQSLLANKPILTNFSKKTDMFGLGMILFFMCFGTLPYFMDTTPSSTFPLNNSGQLPTRGGFTASDTNDTNYSNLKSKIKHFDIKEFFNSLSFKQHYYRDDLPEEMYNLLRNLLSRNPAERMLTPELLKVLNQIIGKEICANNASNFIFNDKAGFGSKTDFFDGFAEVQETSNFARPPDRRDTESSLMVLDTSSAESLSSLILSQDGKEENNDYNLNDINDPRYENEEEHNRASKFAVYYKFNLLRKLPTQGVKYWTVRILLLLTQLAFIIFFMQQYYTFSDTQSTSSSPFFNQEHRAYYTQEEVHYVNGKQAEIGLESPSVIQPTLATIWPNQKLFIFNILIVGLSISIGKIAPLMGLVAGLSVVDVAALFIQKYYFYYC